MGERAAAVEGPAEATGVAAAAVEQGVAAVGKPGSAGREADATGCGLPEAPPPASSLIIVNMASSQWTQLSQLWYAPVCSLLRCPAMTFTTAWNIVHAEH